MKIFILRHTKSVGNEKKILDSNLDSNLSEEGLKQARELVPILSRHKFDIFIVSPLKRTIKTIKPYLETLSNPKVIVNDLTLEREGGKFIGGPQSGIMDYCEQNNLDKVSFRPKGGESILDVYERAKKFVQFLKENFKNKSILICGHKNFLMCLEIVLTNKDIKEFYSFEILKNGEIKEFNL